MNCKDCDKKVCLIACPEVADRLAQIDQYLESKDAQSARA